MVQKILPSDILPLNTSTPRSGSATSSNMSTLSTPPDSDEPLYTEIRIPLPPIPQSYRSATAPRSRSRAQTLASCSPFHKRRSSSSSTGKDQEKPASRASVMESLRQRNKRSGTVGALAVLPAVLVLSAELFTPRKKGGRSGEKERDGKGD